MNSSAPQWIDLAVLLHQQEQNVRHHRLPSGQTLDPHNLPAHLQAPDVLEFAQKNFPHTQTVEACARFQIEALYQAVLLDPNTEEEVLSLPFLAQDPARVDELYRHASEYTRRLEAEAKADNAYQTDLASSSRSPWLQITLLVLMLLLMGGGGTAYFFYRDMDRYLDTPAGKNQGQVRVHIPRGATTPTVASRLKKAGVIRDSARFYRFVRYYKQWKRLFPRLRIAGNIRLRAGKYKLSTDLTPRQILSLLIKGPPRISVKVTIPEGFNIWKIAARLDRLKICSKQAFLQLARDPDYARRLLGWDSPSLEGYLYPDTYRFHKGTPPDKVIQRMVRRFKQIYTRQFKKKEKEHGWSTHQAVTMASIIEKETGKASERPMISSVFHNRLRRGWQLETDPTVIYGLLPNFNGNLTQRDLHNPHPYNTYKHKGLPPGPIACPGRAAIRAALFPLKTRYMFFVSKNDGSHVFSRTKAEHQRWVNKYQRPSKPPPRR